MMSDASKWLTDDEQAAWQAYRRMTRRLDAFLARDLMRDSGLSMQDYDVLSNLSGDESGRCCAKDLAAHLIWSPSRLSHHLDRMEKRRLVRRSPCTEGRGSDVVLTEQGWAAIRGAAPGHVNAVRDSFMDQLSPQDLRVLRRIGEAVLIGLDAKEHTARPQ
jgi:DNA-binding MarR family transcriptional regulator